MLRFFITVWARLYLKLHVIPVFLLFFSPFCAISQSGVLDLTFGNMGKVATPLNGYSGAFAIALKKNGSILSLGSSSSSSYVLACHNSKGKLDQSFGKNGLVLENDKKPNDLDMALQDDEKIIVCGIHDDFDPSILKLVRYNSEGSVDSSFGRNGIVSESFYGYTGNEFLKIVVKRDGKILALAKLSEANTLRNFVGLIQFAQDGSIDYSFGEYGKLVFELEGLVSSTVSMITYNDKILIGLSSYFNSRNESNVSVYCLNKDGSKDLAFGSLGISSQTMPGTDKIDGISSMAIQRNNKIVIFGVGSSNYSYFGNVLQLNPDGSLDHSFANKGLLVIPFHDNTIRIENCYKVHVQQDSKILIIGTALSTNYDNDFLLLRYHSNGMPDSTFGKHGYVGTDFMNRSYDISICSAIQPDGKLVVAGITKPIGSSATNLALARYELNSLILYNTLKGFVFIDRNRNGIKDTSEVFANNANIASTKASVDSILFHASNGKFSVNIDTGTYVTKVNLYLPYYTTVPAQYTSTNSTYFNTNSLSFALQPIAGKRDLKISVVPVTVARPGFDLQYKIFYTNQGTDTVSNGTIEFIKNNKLIFLSATPANSFVGGDTLRWNFSAFKPMDTASIIVNLKLQAPPLVTNGDTLRLVAAIDPLSKDLTPNNNTSVLIQNVVGSYDPNDKTENHAGSLKVAQLPHGEELTYTIRFQNTGTDTAFNVYIRDTLSDKVDWSTLKMITSSHNFQLTVNDGNKCSWAFNNINLVDSNTNEHLSHGYIVYSVKPKTSLTPGEIINNTAHIYFDYNLPVQTNTERTAIESSVSPDSTALDSTIQVPPTQDSTIDPSPLQVKLISFTASPLGNYNKISWVTDSEAGVDYYEIERSLNGTIFAKIGGVKAGLHDYSFSDYLPGKSINYYRLKMIYKDGKFEYSSRRSVNNIVGFHTSIYPNPVNRQLIVEVESEKETKMQLHIIGMDGKTMLVKQGKVSVGQQFQTVDLFHLQSGSYFLKIIAAGKVQTVIKFQKI